MKERITPIGVIALIAFLSWFIWDDLKDLRGDVHSVEVRISVVETDLGHIKDDVAGMWQDIEEIQKDIAGMQQDMAEIKGLLQSRQQTDYAEASSLPQYAQ